MALHEILKIPENLNLLYFVLKYSCKAGGECRAGL